VPEAGPLERRLDLACGSLGGLACCAWAARL
jgi:hypothetical protein